MSTSSVPRPRSRPFAALLLVPLALGFAACGGSDDEASSAAETPTRAQRDSAIAESALPGAGAVGTALDAAAAAEARAEQHDTIG